MVNLEAIKNRRECLGAVCWGCAQHNARFVVTDTATKDVVAIVDHPGIASFITHAPDDIKALIEEVESLRKEFGHAVGAMFSYP